MLLSTVSFGEFTQLADIIWTKNDASVPETMRRSGLVNEVSMADHTGDKRTFEEIDLEEYATNKDEGDQADSAKVQAGYSKDATLVRRGKDISITVEMRKRNKYPQVLARLTNLGKLVRNRLDLDLSHRIGFGTATTYEDMDGVTVDISTGDSLALFSTAHTLRGSASTYRNRLANNPQLSKGAMEGMEKLIVEQTLNQFGEKMSQEFDILWTTDDPNSVNTARELLQSTAAVSAPNAGVTNVYQGKYRHVVLKRVATDKNGAVDSTKAKYWGIASSTDSTFMLGVHEEPFMNSPTAGSNAEDVSTEDWTYATRGSYMMCIVGARWIKFSSGDGTA